MRLTLLSNRNRLRRRRSRQRNRRQHREFKDALPFGRLQPTHAYEIRLRKDHRGVDLISDALPFGALWYGEPDAISNAIGYAKFFSRSHNAVIRVYDETAT